MLFDDGLHYSRRLRWTAPETPFHWAHVETTRDANQAPTPNEARKGLVHRRTVPKMKKLLRSHGHAFAHLTNVTQYFCCEWLHLSEV